MKYEDQIELFTVGVAKADTHFLKLAATSRDHYFYSNSFKDFKDLSTYIWGVRKEFGFKSLHKTFHKGDKIVYIA